MQTINLSNYRKVALQAKKDYNLTNKQHSLYETILLTSIQKNTKHEVTSANKPDRISALHDLEMAGLIYIRKRDIKTYTSNIR